MWEDMCDIEEKWDGVPNMTDRMSDSIRERQYGQYCHNSSQLSQKFKIVDNCQKIHNFLVIVTIVLNCHNYSQLS